MIAELYGIQDGVTYIGRPVGNSPDFMTLDNIINGYILYSLSFDCVLSRFVLKCKGNDED